MAERTWSDIEDEHSSGCYPKRPLTLVRGEGVWVWDDAGRRYLDCTSGQGVALIGHAHPAVAAAVALQAALGVAISLAIAYVSYEYFEKRFLLLKRFYAAKASEAQKVS
jgi:acetylornithine/succinyldiaminopimelate/putrescine aminotransferase